MSSTAVDLLAEVYALLGDRGIPRETYGRWRTRGREALRPRVHVEHDTADPAPLSRARMLDLLAHGHGTLTNALCTWAVPRDGPAAVLVAGRTAWHAGRGSWRGIGGNARATGTEIQRAQGQTITDAQWEIAAAITAATVEVFEPVLLRMVCTHNEWTPRKTDPHGLAGHDWRDRVGGLLDAPDDLDQEEDGMPDRLLRKRANEQVRLTMAAAADAVAGYRRDLGLDPEPKSDMKWARRIRKGSHDLEDAWAELSEKAAGR